MNPHPLSGASRRDFLGRAAAAAAAIACARTAWAADPAPELLQSHAGSAPTTQPDGFKGLKVGIASYSFRKLPLDAAVKATQRVGVHYTSIKDFHLPLKSTADERKAVAEKFRDAGITPLSCGVIQLPN